MSALHYRFFLTVLLLVSMLGGVGALVYLFFQQPSFANQAFITLIGPITGAVTAQFIASFQWWFGSSKGSSDKTELLRGKNEAQN